MLQTGNINKSLLTLGSCIRALAEVGVAYMLHVYHCGTRVHMEMDKLVNRTSCKPCRNDPWTLLLLLLQAKRFVPYRDSKLTRILQPSLSGNSKMAIVCTISPAAGG